MPAECYDIIYSPMTPPRFDTDGDSGASTPRQRTSRALPTLTLRDGCRRRGIDGHPLRSRPALAVGREAGFATVEFSTAHEIEKKVDGRPRRYPLFLMVARKAA
jgi:hypothetical protein